MVIIKKAMCDWRFEFFKIGIVQYWVINGTQIIIFIGVNSIIMPGVSIGSNVVIGAGSVVTKDIPDHSVAIGVPAKVVSSFDDFQAKIQSTCASDTDLAGITDYRARVERAMATQASKSSH
jgi:carbonic anhydrase/acetyltransferase-like protein (isoleucine patch superfamily)